MKLKVLILDSHYQDLNGDTIPEDATVVHDDNVVILYEFKKDLPNLLGSGRLVKTGNELFLTNIELYQDSVKAYARLTPSVECVINSRNGNKITKLTVKSISFVISINSDERIRTIGEQVYGTKA